MGARGAEEWSRYYETATRHRRAIGGDPLRRYWAKQAAAEKRYFAAATFALALAFGAFYVILIR